MIIEITEDIFRCNDSNKSLSYLIQILTYKQRYELFVDLTTIQDTKYWQKLDFDEQEEIKESYNKIILEGTDPKYFVSKSNNDSNHFDLEEAIKFFNQPISIILENSLNDQPFLKAIIKHFDKTGDIQKKIDQRWIKFENAGGCTNVKNFINEQLQSFDEMSYLYNKNSHIYLRCFVLLDSDKEYPIATIKDEYEKLLSFLDENNVTNHILEKRCMENYMPDEVFPYIENTEKLEDWIKVYLRLKNVQKDFLNINQGFSNSSKPTNRDDLEEKIQELYSDISQASYEILDKGFKLTSFKLKFPQNFNHHQVHKTTLQNRCDTNEFQDILKKITDLL